MHIERIEPNTKEWDLYHGNHISRYRFASEILQKQKSVLKILDISCGAGYGTHFLSLIENSRITGVDISDEALGLAQSHFSKENIKYIKDDCNNLSKLQESSFDAVVSFETLEHLKNYKGFLKSLHSALMKEGQIIVSTPNILVTEHHEKEDWIFHEKEFRPNELFELINEAEFRDIKLYGQFYSDIGELRSNIRHELNILRANPLVRFGLWLQKKLKGHQFSYPLPEKEVDFIIKEVTPQACEEMGRSGPFVLIAVATK